MSDAGVSALIERWSKSGGAERANYQLFLTELCDVLGVPRPDPTLPDDHENAYVFERNVQFDNLDGTYSTGRIDLYKRSCFVLETKQSVEKQDEERPLSTAALARKKKFKKGHGVRGTSGWNDTLLRARGQAEQYARALTEPETRPPFLVVVDVGHTIDLYAEFTQTGGTYVPFPDPTSYRIRLEQLADEEVREQLKLLWTDPLALDPAKRSAKVTREIAGKLAELAKSLEKAKHDPHDVAQFLMRCLFTMFAEDVELLQPKNCFRSMLEGLDDPAQFQPMAEDLWRQMNSGGFSAHLKRKLLKFNGGLFYDPSALAVTHDQLDLLIEAAKADWRDVEPAIFGTLLERALSPEDRHKLGAHYTPRAYVERLVMPTIIEPIRAEWDAVRTAAIVHAQSGDRKEAVKELEAFHDRLCELKVLDPACGSGNFLYVTLEHLKRIEGEVFTTYESIAERQLLLESGHTVDPHQLLGLEINPRAAAIADLVLWIGYLQWHYRTRGNVTPPEPVLKNFKNIECRDALLTWTSTEPMLDDKNKPVTRWDGRTTRTHPVTGEEVPDETARVVSLKYNNPSKAKWPNADYIVGNPPFVANRNFRHDLGDGYTDALCGTYPEITTASDLVMYFWIRAAERVGKGETIQSGLITTNSIRAQQNNKVVESATQTNCVIAFAIPDHPWPTEGESARVRIAMTVVAHKSLAPAWKRLVLSPDHDKVRKKTAISDLVGDKELTTLLRKSIPPDLSPYLDITAVGELTAFRGVVHSGMKPYAKSLIIPAAQRRRLFPIDAVAERHAPKYLNGQDLARHSRDIFVIDFFGLSEDEVRQRAPEAYQYLLTNTKAERARVRNPRLRREFWLFEANRAEFREAIGGIRKYLVTVENSPVRYFAFVDTNILPDQKLRVLCVDDYYFLGSFSSRYQEVFSRRFGTRQGVANTPVFNTRCYSAFPLPDANDSQKSRIRKLAEQIDAHRKRQQELHPTLTMTGMYNVLEKLRSGGALTAKEQAIHEQGLASVLKEIHDELDAAVAEAYGWPVDLSDEEILTRLVALNHERAEEERRGIVRWLRPEFQNPSGEKQQGIDVELVGDEQAEGEESTGRASRTRTKKKTAKGKAKKLAWPKTLSEQAAAVQGALAGIGGAASVEEVAKCFSRANRERVEELLDTLASLGKARELADGRFVAVG